MNLPVGTPYFMAPELCSDDEYDERVDVWSLGVILYIFITGMLPFEGLEEDEVYKRIQNDEPDYGLPQFKELNPFFVDFIKKCLNKD